MVISIILCTYNGENYVEKQLESLFLQTRHPDRIFIIDDASNDRTVELCKAVSSRYNFRLDVTINPTRIGARKNFEKGLGIVAGDYIFLCDQDDYWHPSKIEKCCELLETSNKWEAVFCNGVLVDETGYSLGQSMWDAIYFEKDIRDSMNPRELLYYILLNGNVATGTALALKKETLEAILPFRQMEDLWHDHWIALKLAAKGTLCWLDELLMDYRIHNNQQVGFNSRNNADPDFGNAVRETWFAPLGNLNAVLKTNRFAWAIVALEKYKKDMLQGLSDFDVVIETEKRLKNGLDHNKQIWLRDLPLFTRKKKLLKHWLHGGEYLKISLADIWNI